MKERGGPHYVGQQLAFLSVAATAANGQELSAPGGGAKSLSNVGGSGDHTQATKVSSIMPTIQNGGGPFALSGTAMAGAGGALSQNTNSLNNAQYQSQQQRKKLHQGGQSAHGSNAGSEQRQLNLADMVRGSNIIKQTSFQKREGYPPNPQLSAAGAALAAANGQPEFIKGTQVHKNFELVAEPIVPRVPNQAFAQMQLQHANSQNSNNNTNSAAMKGGQQTSSSSQITYTNTAISTIQGANSTTEKISMSDHHSGLSNGQLGGGSSQHYSQSSSRKNLQDFYTGGGPAKALGQAYATAGDIHQVQQSVLQANQGISHHSVGAGGPPPQYSTNRSVAAKAGQMQIFSNDKYSHLTSNHSTQNAKFQSPAKNLAANGKLVPHHHQSASQQIDNIMDLQSQMIRNKNTSGQQNQKYADYLNRFSTSTSQSIDQQTHNLQLKYRDLRNQMLEQDNNYFHADTASGPESTPLEMASNVGGPNQPFGIQGTAITAQNNGVGAQILQQKRSPNIQKENKTESLGLGISGESMHLEEKSFLKKMGGFIGNTLEIGPPGHASQRQGGSSRKRQELQVNARAFNRGFRPGIDSQHLAVQPRTRYDYVFVRITEEQFDKEFGDKINFQRDPTQQSPSVLTFKNKRISSMGTNSAKKEEQSNPLIIQQATPQLNALKNQMSLRASQELQKDSNGNFFSPLHNKNCQGSLLQGGMEEMISIQNMPQDNILSGSNTNETSSPRMQAGLTLNSCSIISTNQNHIKVITHQGILSSPSEMHPEQAQLHQMALNDCVQDVMSKVQEKGRVVKTTHKKKYIMNALNAAHMRVASIYVIVLDNNIGLISENTDLRATLMSDSSTTSSNNFSSTLTKLQNSKAIQKPGVSGRKDLIALRMQEQANAKNLRARNNSTINSKGYDTDSEVKSTNSTTTSSTLQHFIPTRNFEQNNGSSTTKNSSRSLSQKGTQPRKNFQRPPAVAAQEDSQPFVISKDGVIKKYPPTKIKIVSPFDQTHHENHRINVMLNNYNNFIQLCFRQKGKLNVPAIIKVGKTLGLNLTASMFSDGMLKSREQANMIKEKIIAYICKVINEDNQPVDMPDNPLVQDAITPLIQPVHQYKCYVGKGNNSILIRTLFKTRFWWLLHDKEEIEKVNFMWTQLRKNPIMDTFPCKYEDKKSGLRTHGGSSNASNSILQTPGKLKSKKKLQMQTSSHSLDSNGGIQTSSNDKKDGKEQTGAGQGTTAITPAAQQLSVKLYNKLEDNFHLSNKKAMFLNIRLYYEAMGKDVFNAVPMTFHVKEGLDDPEFLRFKQYYYREEEEIKKQKQIKNQKNQEEAEDGAAVSEVKQSTRRNIWIVKPGENTNRGQGITVLKDMEEIKALIAESTANKKRTCIVQKYIHNPLLINKRKFDIRLYAFLSSTNGNLKGYFYQDGYLRTSCREFTLANLSNRMIHLTNDAVQKHAEDYGKYEAGNKLSYSDFQNYLDKNYGDLNICFERDLLPQMKRLVTDMFRAVYGKIDPKRRINTVEIYGYDFMFDDDFKVYLIEVNTNPCLELGCPLLARLIPTMVENALRLTVDPLFPAPENWSQKKCVVNDICPENRFELIFDEKIDGSYLTDLMKEKNNIIIEIDEEELSDNDVIEKDECEVA